MDILEDTKKKMTNALDHLKGELKTLPSGRANPAMVEKVMVSAYGKNMRLADLASISIPEPRQLLITPYDASNGPAIAKSLEGANLNLRIIREGNNAVRIIVPEMNEETRQKIRLAAKKKCEDAKVSIRNVRRDANEAIKKQKAAGEIPEDLMKKNEKKVQDLTDQYCKLADDATSEKEKEIMKV